MTLLERNERRPSAFTIVELIVVIGIIALLLSLLLPALARARSAVVAATCLSQEREVLAASMLRAQDSENFLPLAGWVRVPGYTTGELAPQLNDARRRRYAFEPVRDPGSLVRERVVSYPLALTPYLTGEDPGEIRRTGSWRQVANRAPVVLFRCPAEEEVTPAIYKPAVGLDFDDPRFMYFDDFPLDYAFNAGLLGFDQASSSAQRRLRGRLAAIRDSSSVVVMGDADPRGSSSMMCWSPRRDGEGSVSLADAINNPASFDDLAPLSSRHRGMLNVAYADGHAEKLELQPGRLSKALLVTE